MRCPRREKVFGPGRAVPLDRNAKARILAYAKAWSARHRQPRQHKGPITRAFLEVLEALLWGFHRRGADPAALTEEPPNPEPQTCQSPPEGRAMNIRPRAGETLS